MHNATNAFCYFRIYKSFTLCCLESNMYTHAQKHKPADGKNNPVCPTLPLLKHKERQGYGCTAVDSQSWVQFFVRKKTLYETRLYYECTDLQMAKIHQ